MFNWPDVLAYPGLALIAWAIGVVAGANLLRGLLGQVWLRHPQSGAWQVQLGVGPVEIVLVIAGGAFLQVLAPPGACLQAYLAMLGALVLFTAGFVVVIAKSPEGLPSLDLL